MTVQRYVNVEFCGGPWDGKVEIFDYPVPPEWHIPIASRFQVAVTPDVAYVGPPVGIYRITDDQRYEVVAITDELLYRTRIAATLREALAYLMRDKKAMHYTWQGESVIAG